MWTAFDLVTRVVIGGSLLIAGLTKLWSTVAWRQVWLASYRLLPRRLVRCAALGLPAAEIGCGLAVISGLLGAGSVLAGASLLAVLAAAVTTALVRHLDISCHCLTRTGELISWRGVARNLALIAAALTVAWHGGAELLGATSMGWSEQLSLLAIAWWRYMRWPPRCERGVAAGRWPALPHGRRPPPCRADGHHCRRRVRGLLRLREHERVPGARHAPRGREAEPAAAVPGHRRLLGRAAEHLGPVRAARERPGAVHQLDARPTWTASAGTELFVRSMYEASRLPAGLDAAAQPRAVVIVPTRFVADVYRASGVTVPIEVVPDGIDPAAYPCLYRPGQGGHDDAHRQRGL